MAHQVERGVRQVSRLSCTCESCVSSCLHKPGWFAPGEAERAARLLRMPFKAFFRRYLGVDWWVAGPDIFVLAPALVRHQAGAEYPGNPTGRCVFLTKENRCRIHAAKPRECRLALHGDPDETIKRHKAGIVRAWRAPRAQAQVRRLLGREPMAAPFSVLDALDVFP